jgi:outer membrane receptor for monomeric catechols
MSPEVVVTTRVATPIEDIPAGVTVITRQEIEEHGYTILAEALSAVPGAMFGLNELGNPTFDDDNSISNDSCMLGGIGVIYETSLYLVSGRPAGRPHDYGTTA